MRRILIFLALTLLLAGCVSTDSTANGTATPGAGGNPMASAVIPYDQNAAPGSNEVMDTQQITFYPSMAFVPKGIVGEHYNRSYCEPELFSVSDICSPEGYTGNPSLGNPPYHFQLDSGKGFPPMGLTLHPNGIVDGVLTTEGMSNFTVCAIDQSGTQACAPESIEVVTAKATFDSLSCTPDQSFYAGPGEHRKYYLTARGTAAAPKDFALHFSDNIAELNDNNPGANIYSGGSEPESTCGAWPGNTNSYCQNSNGVPSINWVVKYYIFSPLSPTVINASVYVDAGYYYYPEHTTTIWKTVTCG